MALAWASVSEPVGSYSMIEFMRGHSKTGVEGVAGVDINNYKITLD